jgi:hypothetical protein
MSAEGFEHELDQVYEQYRHRELDERLNEIAEIMKETVLQSILAETIFGVEIQLKEETKTAVREMSECLERNEFEKVEDRIDDLEQDVEDEHHRVDVRIQDVRSDMADTVSGMKRLNQRLQRVDEGELDNLARLFNRWNWKNGVYTGSSTEDIESLKALAREYGKRVRQSYNEAKEKLFGPYEGTELESIVDGLLNEKRFALNNLSDEQLERLRDSEIEEHVELSLS